MYRVGFGNTSIEVEAGCTLMEAQRRAGLAVDAPCGGKGLCGKCDVQICEGGDWRTVRACRYEIVSDIEVRAVRSDENVCIMTDAAAVSGRFDPQVRLISINVHRCAKGESTSDWDRLCEAVVAAGGPTAPKAIPKLASKIGSMLRGDVTPLCAVCTDEAILDVYESPVRVLMAAFDIGTTTIAGFLIDAETGKTIAEDGMLNPQTAYGADVISRIDYSESNGVRELCDCVRSAADEMLGRMCAAAGVARENVYAVSIVGNTCMHHLFLGISPRSLVKTPYNPALSQPLLEKCSEYGLRAHPSAPLLVLPVIAGFVGADTVGCMLAERYDELTDCTLMIDIGTNGELVLGDRDRMIACSTAAGPAFEGAKISMGMRGAAGAVDHVTVNGEGEIEYHVIGDAEPKGICGSGLIDLVAALLKTELIDETGRFDEGDSYTLPGSSVTLTQKDVREVQLAKAAICAGIRLMAERLGKPLSEIRKVHIAGAFGSYMNPDSACAIGMIPAELLDRIDAVGNAAGAGARQVLLDRAHWNTAAKLAKNAEFLELASLPDFQDTYVDELMFGDMDDD